MQKQRTGFSRWELLALGGVTSAAGALLLPALAQSVDQSRAEENQRASACASNLKQVGLGLLQYQQDYDERMPLASLSSWNRMAFSAYGWADAVKPYIKNNAYYQCPSEKNPAQNNPTKPGYTDYWLNSNASGISVSMDRDGSYTTLANLIMIGDGDGGSLNSTARYNLSALPQSWISTANSPARRHHDFANYAFADGHVKRLAPSQVGSKQLSFKFK